MEKNTLICKKCNYKHYLGRHRELIINFCHGCGAEFKTLDS